MIPIATNWRRNRICRIGSVSAAVRIITPVAVKMNSAAIIRIDAARSGGSFPNSPLSRSIRPISRRP
jgi:hypothetical protein